ncbi:MAG: PadR family transcriptional regulator, regulatory protein PadR [Frankiales bacterium]|nr:PadR family transcriptional regulator [Frankiales bacterium]MDX6219347.1 PadR family transcriptional regulator, regulatory protein PadR [Frankiales bacterium]
MSGLSGCLVPLYTLHVPRRRADVLLPLEESVLEVGLGRAQRGEPDFHGFALAEEVDDGHRSLTAHGTLYKVLDRLETRGLLVSRWESDEEYDGGRPRRRLYRVTADAAVALARSRDLARSPGVLRPGIAAT